MWKCGNSLRGKVFIITGANTGLGFETAKIMTIRGATVIMACRDLAKANDAITSIRKETENGELIALELDLACFESIEGFCKSIKEKYSVFDCLINNAGLAMRTNQSTKNDIEIHCGTNHIGHFLLTNLLMDNIEQNEARVVIVSSKMHEKASIDFENFGKFTEGNGGARPNHLYNSSKLMNFYFAKELYKRGVDVHVCCPALCKTALFRDYNLKFFRSILFSPSILYFRSPQREAQNIVFCATEDMNTDEMNPDTAFAVVNLKKVKSKVNLNDDISERLWRESAKLCGLV